MISITPTEEETRLLPAVSRAKDLQCMSRVEHVYVGRAVLHSSQACQGQGPHGVIPASSEPARYVARTRYTEAGCNLRLP